MSRPLRIEYPGAFYHVTSRGRGLIISIAVVALFFAVEHKIWCFLLRSRLDNLPKNI